MYLDCQPMEGAVKATSVVSAEARSSGKLCAFLSCITSIPKFALLRTSPHVGTVSYTHLRAHETR